MHKNVTGTWRWDKVILGAVEGVMGCVYNVGNCFEILELGNMIKSWMVSSVVNILIHFTDGLSNSHNRVLLTGSSL